MPCKDNSLTFLAGLGYNVIRHPDSAFAPLKLLGEQKGEFIVLGSLNQLIKPSADALPNVTADQPAADINGQRSSSLKLGIGANILGSLISAMGGSLSANVNYTDATQVTFEYQDVLADSVTPLDAGNYLRDGHVDVDNLVLKQYVLGNGKLYLITKIVKSDKFTAKYSKNRGVDASVQVPVIQAAVSGNLTVATAGGSSTALTFTGKTALPFGFQCFAIGLNNGELSLMNTRAGDVFGIASGDLAADPLKPAILGDGLLNIGKH